MNFKSLSDLQAQHMKFRTIPVYEKSIVTDLSRGKFSVMVIECNLQRAYGSPVHKMALRQWPQLSAFGEQNPNKPTMGSYENYNCPNLTSQRLKIVSNLYSAVTVVGVPIDGEQRLPTRAERFCPQSFKSGLRSLINDLKTQYPNYNFDRQIAVQRFGGGFAGADWTEVQDIIDEVCNEFEINILAYLPRHHGKTTRR